MYKAMHGLAPAYLSELCASSCVEGWTRSSARGDLVVQQMRTKFGSADVHSSSQVRQHGTGCRAPFATLRPWTVSRRLWRHFSSLLTFNSPFLTLMLLHALYERLCTAPLNRLPCYGALEVIGYRDIIIIIIIIMEVVVTTRAISRAKFQSNRHHQQTNTQLFTGRMSFLSPNQQCQSTKGKYHIHIIIIKGAGGKSDHCQWKPDLNNVCLYFGLAITCR